jgi:UDP-glucose 4-epimerase
MMVVTGAAGFIGSHLVDRLLLEGHTVVGADNLCRGSRENLATALVHKAFSLVEIDLSDAAKVEREFVANLVSRRATIDTIWHMAANSDISAGVANPDIDLRDTFATTYNILTMMRLVGARRIVFASTSAVYGVLPGKLVETTGPLLPISNYGAMKLAGEAIISAAAEAHLEQGWLYRFPNVVGGRATHGIIFDLFKKLERDSKELDVLGDGRQCKPYLHVLDLIDAMLFIWRTAGGKRELYNIGPDDDGVEVAKIAKAVVEASGTRAQIRFTGGDRGWIGDVPRFSYSVEKLARLGWRPKRSSEDAIRLAIAESAGGETFE